MTYAQLFSFVAFSGSAFFFACAEVESNPPDPSVLGITKDAGEMADRQNAQDSAVKMIGSGDAAALQGIVFNEINASGGDFLEIYNTTSAPVDLSGYKIADNASDASTPRVSEALTLANGMTIAPGDYLVVQAKQADASATSYPCFDGGLSCVGVTWGISASKENVLFLLSASDEPVLQVDVPASAAPSGNSYGRFPNGTGDFTVTKPTPGAANTQ